MGAEKTTKQSPCLRVTVLDNIHPFVSIFCDSPLGSTSSIVLSLEHNPDRHEESQNMNLRPAITGAPCIVCFSRIRPLPGGPEPTVAPRLHPKMQASHVTAPWQGFPQLVSSFSRHTLLSEAMHVTATGAPRIVVLSLIKPSPGEPRQNGCASFPDNMRA